MDLAKLREEVAKEHKLALYRHYSEKEAAAILSKDVGTLKRWRKQGILPHVRLGDSVRYFGYQLVDVMLKGTSEEGSAEVEVIKPTRGRDAWRDIARGSDAGSGTSPSATTPTPGTGPEAPAESPSALAYKLLMSRKPSGA